MARAGKRYTLLLYTRMMDRWWPAVFFIGLGLIALAWPFYQDLYVRLTEPWRWMTLAGLGLAVIIASLFMLALRNSAYIQPYDTYFKLATPFLRMNVSYQRVQRTATASMASLFPPRSLKGLKREILEPLAARTALVIELNGYPIPRSTLRLFLSPFFFKIKDRTPHLVILVRDWMGLSTALESMRVSGRPPVRVGGTDQSVLSRLPRK